MEIERRWLVDGWPEGAPAAVLEMDQGYLAVRPALDRAGLLPRHTPKGGLHQAKKA